MIPHGYVNASDDPDPGAYAADQCDRQAVTVEFAYKHLTDEPLYLYSAEAEDNGLDPWSSIDNIDATPDAAFYDLWMSGTRRNFVLFDHRLYAQRSSLRKLGLPDGTPGSFDAEQIDRQAVDVSFAHVHLPNIPLYLYSVERAKLDLDPWILVERIVEISAILDTFEIFFEETHTKRVKGSDRLYAHRSHLRTCGVTFGQAAVLGNPLQLSELTAIRRTVRTAVEEAYRDALIDNARDTVLSALDAWVKTSGLALPKGQEGATDADLPALFKAIDTHVDKLIARSLVAKTDA